MGFEEEALLDTAAKTINQYNTLKYSLEIYNKCHRDVYIPSNSTIKSLS